MENKRELILDMLIEILEKENYSHLVIRDVLDSFHQKSDRRNVREADSDRLYSESVF